MNIVDPILFQCRRQPPAAAICAPGPGIGLISYARLERFIHNISRRLVSAGLTSGQVVAVEIGDSIFHIAVLLALARRGIASVSVRGPAPPAVKLDAFISDGKIPPRVIDRLILADVSWTEGEGKPIEAAQINPDGSTLCRVILTSGTTGDPKGVPISHKLLAGRIARHLTVFGNRLANCQRIYSDMPIVTSLGFQFLIYTLWRGGTFFLPGDTLENTLQAIEQYEVQCVLAPPNGLELFLKWFEAVPAYQSNIELTICGGDLMSEALSNRARARICAHLISAYGSTEASITASAHAQEIDRIPGAVGYITPGIEAQIVDRDSAVVSPVSDGRLRIRSEFAVDGYLGHPADSHNAFRDGWFYPGDLARLDADGLLIITGREKATLNLGGDKVNPEAIESVVGSFPGILDAAVCGVPNELGNNELVAVIVSGAPVDVEAVRAHCREHLPTHLTQMRFMIAEGLPRNAMGKIDRGRLAESLRGVAIPDDGK